MKLLDEWMDMVEGIKYSDEVAEQRRVRLEKYQGPGSFVSQAFQQFKLLIIGLCSYSIHRLPGIDVDFSVFVHH
jgi:hypothetical protein